MTTSAILDIGDVGGDFSIKIYDIQGRLVRAEQQASDNNQLRIERGGLEAGQYLLRLGNGDSESSLTFTIE